MMAGRAMGRATRKKVESMPWPSVRDTSMDDAAWWEKAALLAR